MIEVATGLVTSADAVPQWHQPGSGRLSADTFLPVLERAGLRSELSDLSLNRSCSYLVQFGLDGLDLEVTVQLASESLNDTALADRAASTARAHGADSTRITFALDERALRNSPGSALDVLTRLRVKGFGVAIENFGAGNAPADHLRRVPFTHARLAPTLVAGAAQDAYRLDALEAVAELARTLDVFLVGTGCESEDELRLLIDLGCDRVLGAFIASAMPGPELPAWLAAWHPERLTGGEPE